MRFKGDFETIYWVFPHDANLLGYLFGGRLMNWTVRTASIYASILAKRPVLLGYMGSFDFINPIRVGDMVSINVSPLFSTQHTITLKIAIYSRSPYEN
ncbi:MAG: acyl-CoA thioesterase, partial [Candidatus Caldipriscus sp.]